MRGKKNWQESQRTLNDKRQTRNLKHVYFINSNTNPSFGFT